jgi:hypothetical protein
MYIVGCDSQWTAVHSCEQTSPGTGGGYGAGGSYGTGGAIKPGVGGSTGSGGYYYTGGSTGSGGYYYTGGSTGSGGTLTCTASTSFSSCQSFLTCTTCNLSVCTAGTPPNCCGGLKSSDGLRFFACTWPSCSGTPDCTAATTNAMSYCGCK